MKLNDQMRLVVALVIGLGLSSVVWAEEDGIANPDPWAGLNHGTHNVNDFADRKLLKPLALGYRKLVPGFARQGVSNVFSNLRDVGDAVNNLLQGKIGKSASDLGRVLVNSTLGIAGLFDPASRIGLNDHEEDWGQTLGVWGVPQGPYLVIPVLGPSSVRDGLARILDGAVNPLRYLYPVADRNAAYVLRSIQNRSDLIAMEGVVFGDKYIFYRDAYLQRRDYLVNDGEVSDPFADDF